MNWNVSQAARILETDIARVKKWAVLFKDFLSVGANPPKGQARMFSDSDMRVLAEVNKHWEPNPDLESIRAGLGSLDENDDEEFRQILYANTPILQEPPEGLDETWSHGFILNGAGLNQYLQLARVYRQSAEALLETALRDGEPHEWGYPVFFAYRHTLELYLKIIGEIDEPTHSLRRCICLVEKQRGKLNPQIKSWIEELDRIDPKGTAFRYADDEDGTLMCAEHWVDLHQFKFAMSKTFEMIDSAILRLGVTGRPARKRKKKAASQSNSSKRST